MAEGKEKVKMTREFAAGGVVFRNVGKETLWLITQSTPSEFYPDSFWRLPKGWLDDEDEGKKPGPQTRGVREASETEFQNAALREVEEEGGVVVEILDKIKTLVLSLTIRGRGKVLKFITFYLMRYSGDSRDGFGFETSEIAWLSYSEARKRLSFSSEKEVLDEAVELLESKGLV